MKRRGFVVAVLLASALVATPALGQTTLDPNTRIKQLEQQVAELTKGAPTAVAPAPTSTAQTQIDLERRIKELEALVQQLLKDRDIPKQKLMNQAEQERTLEPASLITFYDNGYLIATSADGAFKYWLDGRVNLDFATYRGAANRLPTGFEVRRGRLGLKSTLFTNWLAEVDIDFTDNLVEIKDMWMGYTGIKNMLIKVGNHKTPFGLDTLTSSKNITFMERAYIDAWAPDRLMGLNVSGWGSHWQASAGIYGEAAGVFNDKDSLTGGGAGTSQRPSFIGRLTVAPLAAKGKVLHFGVAFANRRPEVAKIATSGADLPDRLNASRIVKFDSRAETHVSRAKFLSTGDMKYVDYWNQMGAEVAAVMGPVNIQAEYQTTTVVRTPTAVASYVDHTFTGYYGQISVFLTGERRPYSVSEGEFARLIPTRRGGAVEVGVRYSVLDLDDETALDPIKGGAGKNITAGLTWYLNANHKILFNFVNVTNSANAKPNKEYAPLPVGTSTTQSVVMGDDFRVFAIRYQIAF